MPLTAILTSVVATLVSGAGLVVAQSKLSRPTAAMAIALIGFLRDRVFIRFFLFIIFFSKICRAKFGKSSAKGKSHLWSGNLIRIGDSSDCCLSGKIPDF